MEDGRKKTAINFVSLASVELLNLLLPLITMPYLMVVLGVNNYGLNSFVQAIMQFFIIVTNYGFNVTATQEIAVNRAHKDKIAQIYSTVIACKLLLTVGCFLVLLGMIAFIPKMQAEPSLYLLMFGIVIGSVFLPVWFFQGIEEMKNIGLLNFISKAIFTGGLFIFVKNPSDLPKVAILNSLGYLVVGVLASAIVRYKYDVRFQRPVWQQMLQQFQSSWSLFVSTLSTSLYTTTNIFFLGLIAGNTATGYFNIANTLVRVCASVASPIVQTFYPRVSQLVLRSKKEALQVIRKIWLVVTVVFTTGCLILLFGSGPVLRTLFGGAFAHSVRLIQIMSFLPLVVAWSNVLGMMTMTTFGYKKQLSKIYLFCGILSVMSVLVLTFLFKEVGTALNAVMIETLVTILMSVFLARQHIHVATGQIQQGGKEE